MAFRPVSLMVLCAFFAISAAEAATLTLKNGKKIEGEVLSQTPDHLHLRDEEFSEPYSRLEIEGLDTTAQTGKGPLDEVLSEMSYRWVSPDGTRAQGVTIREYPDRVLMRDYSMALEKASGKVREFYDRDSLLKRRNYERLWPLLYKTFAVWEEKDRLSGNARRDLTGHFFLFRQPSRKRVFYFDSAALPGPYERARRFLKTISAARNTSNKAGRGRMDWISVLEHMLSHQRASVEKEVMAG